MLVWNDLSESKKCPFCNFGMKKINFGMKKTEYAWKCYGCGNIEYFKG